MSDGYLTFDEAKQRLRDATRIVLDAEKEFERAVERAADAEAFYRTKLAEEFRSQREQGKAVQEAETVARAAVAVHSRERDYAAGMLKLAGERIEDARDSRRSLWRLVEWSRAHDGVAPADERAPGDRWP